MNGITEKNVSVKSCSTETNVETIEDIINNCSFNPQDVAKGCSKFHRYLQNELGKFCLTYLAEMVKSKKNGTFDGRNEYVCNMAEKIFDKVEELKCYVEM